jgi:hypothetical protein
LRPSAASKKENDKLEARKTADLVRCHLLPVCYVAPAEMRELRRLLRYRNLVVAQGVRIKNKMSGLLMEVGAECHSLHGKQYFTELQGSLEEVPESVKDLLRLRRGALEMLETTQQQLLQRLQKEPRLVQRLAVLSACFGQQIAAGTDLQQRNAHLQTVLIEAAKLAPQLNRQLAAVHDRELKQGHRNRATLEVARKLVAYLLPVDKSGQPFRIREQPAAAQEVETAA